MNAKLSGSLNQQYIDIKEKVAKVFHDRKSATVGDLPPGQRLVEKMVAMPPIVDRYPHIERSEYSLKIYGEVENEIKLGWTELSNLGLDNFVVDFHCVTRWSKLGQNFSGVSLKKIIELVVPKDVSTIVFEGVEGYTTNVPFKEAVDNGAFVALKMDGQNIEDQYGGPVRMVVPNLYGWKSAKHLVGIKFLPEDEPGFWEVRGYHNHGDPWKEERYS
jgi:DMSO/TMAO reductase YedYZ molybdopterin-dependent catalytic subunit